MEETVKDQAEEEKSSSNDPSIPKEEANISSISSSNNTASIPADSAKEISGAIDSNLKSLSQGLNSIASNAFFPSKNEKVINQRRLIISRHHATIQQLLQQQQLLASCLNSVLMSSLSSDPDMYPLDEFTKAFQAQQQTSNLVNELISLYRDLLIKIADGNIAGSASSSSSSLLFAKGDANASNNSSTDYLFSSTAGSNSLSVFSEESARLPYRSPHDFDSHVRPLQELIQRNRNATAQPPIVQQQQQQQQAVPLLRGNVPPVVIIAPEIQQQPRRRTCREMIVNLVVALDLKLAFNLILLVFVLGYDMPTPQLYLLMGFAFGYYLMKLGLVPNPFHAGNDVVVENEPNQQRQQQQQANGAAAQPNVQNRPRLTGWVMRQGRVPPGNQGGILTDIWIVFASFLLSVIPGWRVLPVPTPVNPAPPQQPAQQLQQQQQ